MKTGRRIAILVGVFYITATIAGLVGLGLSDPVVGADDYLSEVANSENQVLIGALFELIMAVAVSGIAIAIYPVLKKYNASVAIGYFAARIVEALIFIIGVISLLSLLTLSHDFVDAGAPDAAYFGTLGDLLLGIRDSGGHIVLDVAVFPLGALLLYFMLYQTKLVPRWISGWGLIGAVLYWAAGILVMFDLVEALSTPHVLLQAPLGLQEMAFALWLIIKGFDPSAIEAISAAADST